MHLDFGWDGIGYHKVIDQKGMFIMADQNIGLEHM